MKEEFKNFVVYFIFKYITPVIFVAFGVGLVVLGRYLLLTAITLNLLALIALSFVALIVLLEAFCFFIFALYMVKEIKRYEKA